MKDVKELALAEIAEATEHFESIRSALKSLGYKTVVINQNLCSEEPNVSPEKRMPGFTSIQCYWD